MSAHCPGPVSAIFSGFLHHFVLAKLATSSTRVKNNVAGISFLQIIWLFASDLGNFNKYSGKCLYIFTMVDHNINHSCMQQSKVVRQFWGNLSGTSKVGKIFEGDMFIRTPQIKHLSFKYFEIPLLIYKLFIKISKIWTTVYGRTPRY